MATRGLQGVEPARPIGHVRLLEPETLGHGPLWLRLLGDALAPLSQRLSLVHPRDPKYEALARTAARWEREHGTEIRLEPRPWDGARGRAEAVALATAPGADLALVTYLDTLLQWGPPELLTAPPGPGRVWGIWFSPGLAAAGRPSRLRQRVFRGARRRAAALETAALRPPWLDGAFFLDPELAGRVALPRTAVLPDPWPERPRLEQGRARRELGLPAGARLFLQLGVPETRKGLADAIAAWPRTPAPAVLVRAGPVHPRERAALRALEGRGRAVLHERYPSDADLDRYVRACDWLLLAYRRHEGSSGVLSAAAAGQRPVVAADYGVLGRRVREEGLGLVHRHRSRRALARAVSRALDTPIAGFAAALDAFSARHHPAVFADAIRAALAPPAAPWASALPGKPGDSQRNLDFI